MDDPSIWWTAPKNEAYKQNQAMQLIGALGPLVGQVVDPGKLAAFVLEAHGIKDAQSFIMAPGMMPPGPGGGMPPEGEMPPEEMPPELAMEAPFAGDEPPPEPEAEAGAIPPAILQQLANQVGLNLPGGM